MNIKFLTNSRTRRWMILPGLLFIISGILVLNCTDQSLPTYSASEAGIVWELRESGTTEKLNGIIWDGEMYVVVGGTSIYTSKDARDWQLRYTNAPGTLLAVCWSGRQYIAVGVHCILVSSDAISWRSLEFSGVLYGVAANDTLAVAVGDSGLVVSSRDLMTWHRVYYTHATLEGVVWAPDYVYHDGIEPDAAGAFVIGGIGPIALYYPSIAADSFITIASNSGGFGMLTKDSSVVLASGGACFTILGPSSISTGDCGRGRYYAIAESGNGFVAVGYHGEACRCEWERTPSGGIAYQVEPSHAPVEASLHGVVSVGNGCIAVGDHGVILASPPNRPN